MKLIAIATHPIQYHIPLWQLLHQDDAFDFSVWYGFAPDAEAMGAAYKGKFEWDIPLLSDYEHRFIENRAKHPAVGVFNGIHNWRVYFELKKEKPDAVLITGWQSRFLIECITSAKLLGIPIIYRGESIHRKRPKIVQWYHRWLLHDAIGALYIGNKNRAFYEYYGVDPSKLFPTPYFVDNERFAAQRAAIDRQHARQTASIDENCFVLMFCGRFAEMKHVDDLIHAANRSNQNLLLMLVGSGELEDELRAIAGPNIRFMGFKNQTEMGEMHAIADALVLASDTRETWGLVANEAMACGLPVIASDEVGCANDLVLHGKTGYVYPRGDIDALTAAFDAICDRKTLETLGANAREHVQHYHPNHVIAALHKLCEHLS